MAVGFQRNWKKTLILSIRHLVFSKKALSAGEKIQAFQPRGPERLVEGDWEYNCKWGGNITLFNGNERIMFKGKIVFTHKFMGGLVKAREQ